jgi:hypothetical protein
MIGTQNTALAENAFEDAIEATVYMATVHVREGELALPERIRAHLADGPVVVHLMRGEHDVAVHEATLTSRSTLTGIVWPDDVKPKTSLTVLCPRGGASHDIGVLLPNLNVDWPDTDLPGTPEPEPVVEPEPAEAPEPVTDEQLAAITGALTALAEAGAVVETVLASPAEYEVPDWRETDLQVVRASGGAVAGELELPAEPWPGTEDLAAGETTETFTAVLAPVVPDIDVDVEPGSVFSAALVAVRTPAPPKRRAGWLERRVREAARLVLDHSWTATRVVMAVTSFLVLASTGVGFLLAEVAR